MNRAFAAVKLNNNRSRSIGRERNLIPMLELAMAVPQFHWRAVPPVLRERKRGVVIDRLEFSKVIDVTAEAVHEVQAIVKHPRHPRVASRLLSLIHKPDESAETGSLPLIQKNSFGRCNQMFSLIIRHARLTEGRNKGLLFIVVQRGSM